jgi:hypothetical protein
MDANEPGLNQPRASAVAESVRSATNNLNLVAVVRSFELARRWTIVSRQTARYGSGFIYVCLM